MKKNEFTWIAGAIGVTWLLVACGGGDDGSGSGSTGSKSTKSATDKNQPAGSTGSATPDTSSSGDTACVAPGAKANDKGIGAYCDSKTRCPSDSICTGDFGAPVGKQFCTKVCQTDADCGSGAVCFAEARGKGCVISACME